MILRLSCRVLLKLCIYLLIFLSSHNSKINFLCLCARLFIWEIEATSQAGVDIFSFFLLILYFVGRNKIEMMWGCRFIKWGEVLLRKKERNKYLLGKFETLKEMSMHKLPQKFSIHWSGNYVWIKAQFLLNYTTE